MSTIIRTPDSRGPSWASHRQAHSGESPEDVAARIVDRARTEAQQIRSDAETAAAALWATAEQDTTRQQAALMEAGRRDIEQELDDARQLLASVVTEIQTRRRQWLAAWEQQALELALAIAGRILRRELARESDLAVQLVRESLELATGAVHITVRLNPDDLKQWRDDLQSVLRETHAVANTSLVEDPQVSRGGCRIATEFGEIDQTIESQLARITEELCDGN